MKHAFCVFCAVFGVAALAVAEEKSSVTEDGQVYERVWTAEVPGGRNSTHQVALSPDGKFLAVAARDSKASLHVFDVENGVELTAVESRSGIRTLQFHSGSTDLLVTRYDGKAGSVSAYSFVNGSLTLREHVGAQGDPAAAYVGSSFVYTDRRGNNRLQPLILHKAGLLDTLPDWGWNSAVTTDRYLVVAHNDGKAFVLQRNGPHQSRSFENLLGNTLRTSADGAYLASFSITSPKIDIVALEDKGLVRLDTVDASTISSAGYRIGKIADLAFLPGTELVYTDGYQLTVYNWSEKKVSQVLVPKANGTLVRCTASADGKYIATAFEAMGIYPQPHGHNVHLFKKKEDLKVAGKEE
ncbi:MAG: hypothetical protein WEC84_03550 [Candidatus Andersenbacteria bacterium]